MPYGVSESYVTVYETEKYIDEFGKMISDSGRDRYVSAARTVTVVPFQ